MVGLGSGLRCDAGRSGVVVVVVGGTGVDFGVVGTGEGPYWSWNRLMRGDYTSILFSMRCLFVHSNKVNYGGVRNKKEPARKLSRYFD